MWAALLKGLYKEASQLSTLFTMFCFLTADRMGPAAPYFHRHVPAIMGYIPTLKVKINLPLLKLFLVRCFLTTMRKIINTSKPSHFFFLGHLLHQALTGQCCGSSVCWRQDSLQKTVPSTKIIRKLDFFNFKIERLYRLQVGEGVRKPYKWFEAIE